MSSQDGTANFDTLFPGRSEMAQRLRNFDWLASPLGPPSKWQQNLKTSVQLMLNSNHPMFVWWGNRLINLYNDGYADFLQAKHPAALGQPASKVWAEIWNIVGPRAEFAMGCNEGTYDEALRLIMLRKGFPEETYVTFSYSPIPSDAGGSGGILCPVTEDTKRIIGERQLSLLRELATQSSDARTCDEACEQVARAIEINSEDLPFALIYVTDPATGMASLKAKSALKPGIATPETVALDSPCFWPLKQVLDHRRPVYIRDLAFIRQELSSARDTYAVNAAIALPILVSFDTEPGGVFIAGLNPLRTFDEDYHHFLELVASTCSAAITNSRAYESEKQRAEALAELDRAKTAFFSNVSHEFRTPLTLILGPLAGMLGRGNETLTVSRDELDLVYRNALRLLKLVNALLDFSRMESDRVKAHYEPTNLAVFTAELASFFRSAVENAGLAFEVNCPSLGQLVYVDRGMWEKIVLNLVSNAFKFTFAGGISVSLSENHGFAELSVRDTGVGIPEQEVPRIFERFHRVEGVRGRTYEGSGIGLALVKELTEIHHGTVRVQSTFGVGSEFVISIPLGRAHLRPERVSTASELPSLPAEAGAYVAEAAHWLPDDSASKSAANSQIRSSYQSREAKAGTVATPSDPQRARILLADDNADMRRYMERLLSDIYDVQAVGNGEVALQAAQGDPPDLVLSDIMMPGMNGLELTRKLSQDLRTSGTPVVLISARAGEESQLQALESGAADYLVKPFSGRELLARVGLHVVLKRTRDALQRELESREHSLSELTREVIASRRALQRSEAYLAEGQRISHTGTCAWNLSNGELFWSKEHCRIFGVSPDEPRQSLQSLLNRVHPDDREIVRHTVDEAFLRKTGFDLDYRIVHSDGAVRYIQASGQPISDHSIEFIGTVMDITDRKRLDDEKRKLASVVENSPNWIGFASLDGQLQLINPAGRRLLGLDTSPDVQGITLSDCIAAGDRDDFDRHVMSKVWIDGHWEGERSIKNLQTGAITPILQQIFVIREPGTERPSALALIGSDITERKRAEEEVRRREAYLARSESLSHTGTWAWNVAKGTLFWSEEHYRIVGLEPKSLVPSLSSALEFIHPEERTRIGRALEEAMLNKAEFEVDCRLLRPDGTIRFVHSRACPVFDDGGELQEYAGTIIDNTERKQAEEALQRAQTELAHMARVTTMGELAASIAHEVNQPLSSVVNDAGACLAWLRRAEPNVAEAISAAARIAEEGVRASDVLARVRASFKKSPPQAVIVHLNDLIKDVLFLTRYKMFTHNVVLFAELADELAAVRGDPVQLKQVLANLVINAIEAMLETAEKPRQLLISSKNLRGAEILVAVTDSGPGIDPSTVEELFKPFVTHKSNGMGMGLAIGRSIIEAHGGRLWATRNDMGGATFQFCLNTSEGR